MRDFNAFLTSVNIALHASSRKLNLRCDSLFLFSFFPSTVPSSRVVYKWMHGRLWLVITCANITRRKQTDHGSLHHDVISKQFFWRTVGRESLNERRDMSFISFSLSFCRMNIKHFTILFVTLSEISLSVVLVKGVYITGQHGVRDKSMRVGIRFDKQI